MNININFSEITGFVEENYKQKITIERVDAKAIEVYYKPCKYVPQVSVRLNVTSVSKDSIQLSYDGSIGVPLLINGAVKIFKEVIPTGVEIDADNRTIKVYPRQVEQLQKALEYVYLSDIAFTDEAVNITLTIV